MNWRMEGLYLPIPLLALTHRLGQALTTVGCSLQYNNNLIALLASSLFLSRVVAAEYTGSDF